MISSARNNGRTNEDWFHKYSCHSSRASEICQRPSIVTLVTHIHSNLYMKRWTRLVINTPWSSSTIHLRRPQPVWLRVPVRASSSPCLTCLVNLRQVLLPPRVAGTSETSYSEESHFLISKCCPFSILLMSKLS